MKSLYIHIPFCSHLCHYCDFVKTANYREETVEAYFKRLHVELQQVEDRQWETIFIGGGTPGLFADEYRHLLGEAAEVTIEANPLDCTEDKLQTWRDLGINRLSIGVQTFDAKGLQLLSRNHDPDQAKISIERALRFFSNVNVDLIYGWPGQDSAATDAALAAASGVQHISAYALSYEFGTTLYRKLQRKVISPLEDDDVADRYEEVQDVLASRGFRQDEVSNWHLPGFACLHNKIYWQDGGYEGIGAGAHGYREDPHGIGLRYRQSSDLRLYIAGAAPVVEQRQALDWLREYVGCALRCEYGLDLQRITTKSGYVLEPDAQLHAALQQGSITIDDQKILRLDPREWYRETSWALRLLEFFREP